MFSQQTSTCCRYVRIIYTDYFNKQGVVKCTGKKQGTQGETREIKSRTLTTTGLKTQRTELRTSKIKLNQAKTYFMFHFHPHSSSLWTSQGQSGLGYTVNDILSDLLVLVSSQIIGWRKCLTAFKQTAVLCQKAPPLISTRPLLLHRRSPTTEHGTMQSNSLLLFTKLATACPTD